MNITLVNQNQRKPHSIPHVLSRVFGCPLLIDPIKAEVIANVVLSRGGVTSDSQLPPQASYLQPSDRQERKPYEVVNQIAIIDISGALVNRSSGMDAWSGLTSYEQLNFEVSDAAADPNIKAVLLRFDSPGGEVHGCFDLADSIIKASAIKPVWASVDDVAYSAGYLLASACSKIYVTRTSGVGSIGVVAMRLDVTKMDADMGVRYNFIYAGDRKVDNNPHTKFSDPAEEAIRAEIDRVYGMFCGLVAKQRGLSLQAVKDTQAGLFSGPDAIKMKLADEVGTFPQAFSALNKETSKQTNGSGPMFSTASALAASSNLQVTSVAEEEAEEEDEDSMPMDPPHDPMEPPEEENCGKGKKKKMQVAAEDLHTASESTTLPFAQNLDEVVSAGDNQRKDDDSMSQATTENKETKQEATTATTITVAAPAAPVATTPDPVPVTTTAPAPRASLDFVMDMCEVAGITDTVTARQIHAMGLDDSGVRKELIKRKSESQSPESVASHITHRTSSAPAGVTVKAEMFGKMVAEAKTLAASAPTTGPKLSYHQHVARLLESNPAAYDEYLRANPVQCQGSQG